MTKEEPLENQMWQPVVAERRWNWFASGLVNFLFALILALAFWWIAVDPRFSFGLGIHELFHGFYASVIAGFGIMAIVVAIWFDHWPYGRFKDIFSHAMWGTIINVILIVVAFLFFWFIIGPFFIPMFSPFVLVQIPFSIFASDATAAIYLSASAMGTILSCAFSFAAIWIAGGMYWPFTELEPRKRGFAVFCMGAVITALAWFILYWPYQQLVNWPLPAVTLLEFNPWTAMPIWSFYATFDPTLQITNAGAFISLNFTQWIIVFGLLTLMAYEYRPWSWAGKQPWIGVVALVGCILLGAIFGLFLMPIFFLPWLWGLFGLSYTAIEYQVMSTYLAVWILLSIFMWTQFFSNKPTKFNPSVNDFIRTFVVIFIGVLFWFLYPILAPLLIGESTVAVLMNPIRWALWLLWFMMIVTYILKRWPGWRIHSFAEGQHRSKPAEPVDEPED